MSDAAQLQAVPLPAESCKKPSCRREYWSLLVSPFPHDRGAIVLTGRVFGHPKFADNSEVVTNPLWLIVRTETADLVYTNTTVCD